jgi:hypothetical protein
VSDSDTHSSELIIPITVWIDERNVELTVPLLALIRHDDIF